MKPSLDAGRSGSNARPCADAFRTRNVPLLLALVSQQQRLTLGSSSPEHIVIAIRNGQPNPAAPDRGHSSQ